MKQPKTIEIGEREVKRVGLGTNRLAESPQNRGFLEEALDVGLDFIDTAHLYSDGASEATIGAVLDPPREDVLVATKGGYRDGGGTAALQAEFEQSIEHLGVERIDLYYLHRDHPDAAIEDKMELLRGYVDDGRLAAVGLSEVGVDQIDRARSIVPIAAVQNEYSLTERKHEEVIDHCEAEGIAFVPFFPLRGSDSDVAADVAERNDLTPDQVAVAWLLQRSPAIAPIPGTLSIQHLRENLAALQVELASEDIAALDGVARSA